MCKGGSKTTQTSSNKVDPEQMKLFMQNYQSAQNVANTPFQLYSGERVAPANSMLNQSFDMFGNIGANNTGASTLDWAKNLTAGVPQTLANTDLSPYMNPFTKNVIDTTLADLERSRQIQQSRDAAKATAAGAFGGSRSGVMAAETNRAYDQNAASTLANLNLQNFNQAQNAKLDQARLGLTAGAQMGALSDQELSQALQRAGALNQVGQQQRTIQQQMNDAAYEEFLRQVAYPAQQQQLRNQSLGLFPIQQTQTTNSKTTNDPGLLGTLTSLGSIATGLESLGALGGILGSSPPSPISVTPQVFGTNVGGYMSYR